MAIRQWRPRHKMCECGKHIRYPWDRRPLRIREKFDLCYRCWVSLCDSAKAQYMQMERKTA